MKIHKKIAVFIDRDGVINDVVDRGSNFFVKGRQVRFTAPYTYGEFNLKPDAGNALDYLKRMGFLRILVTNQPDLAYGLISKEDYERIMSEVFCLGFDDIFVCLHKRDEDCDCKKPKPGMLLQAGSKWNIDFSMSYIIGDAEIDMLAGNAVGCKTILVNSNYNQKVEGDFRAGSLLEAVQLINTLKGG